MPSPAQLLPALILEKIAMYTFGVYNWGRFCDLNSDKDVYRPITPFLEVCSAWREAALDRIYRDVLWCNANGYGVCCRNMGNLSMAPKSLSRALDAGSIARVKSVGLHIDCLSMLDGSPLEIFDAAPFRNLVLSGVMALDFAFENSNGDLGDAERFNNPDIARSFCDKLNRVFPNGKKRRILSSSAIMYYESSPFVRTLFSGLFSNSATLDTTNIELDALAYLHATLPNLRHLLIDNITTESPAIELTRRNAETLEKLHVESGQSAVFSKVVVADDGTPIAYPHVRSLNVVFHDFDDFDNQSRLDSPAGIPFPALERLTCGYSYPFGNDILFRGNRHTLEYLRIWLTTNILQLFKSHGIISPDHLPSLRYAHGSIFCFDRGLNSSKDIDFFLKLASNASVILTDFNEVSLRLSDMEIGHFGENITVLALKKITFTLHEILELVSRLPHLNKLRTGIVETDELRSADRLHDDCRGVCKITWMENLRASHGTEESSVEDNGRLHDDSGSDIDCDRYSLYADTQYDYKRIRDFFFAHLDTIYADMEFVDELYQRYYPLSKTLCLLDAIDYLDSLMAGCKTIAILYLLCPTIRRVQTHYCMDRWDSDPKYWKKQNIERQEMEQLEQHTSLVSHVQLSNLSIC